MTAIFKKLVKRFIRIIPPTRRLHDRWVAMQCRLNAAERTLHELRYEFFKSLSPEKRAEVLADQWSARFPGARLNLDNPVTFNEKVQWLKLHGDTPLMTRLADKIEVRAWVAERIGEQYLVPLLGTWDDANEINFDALPSKFVLKANHGCAWVKVVNDKEQLDFQKTRQTANSWLQRNFAFYGPFEMQYSRIRPRLLAEKLLENENGDLYDYKLWCFKGKCHFIQFLSERWKKLKMAFFDRDWNLMPFVYNYPRNDHPPQKPSNLSEMIQLAEKLASGFEFVRVDFYRLNDGTVYFGEMTFTSANGTSVWDPPEWNEKLGSMFDISPGNLVAKGS